MRQIFQVPVHFAMGTDTGFMWCYRRHKGRMSQINNKPLGLWGVENEQCQLYSHVSFSWDSLLSPYIHHSNPLLTVDFYCLSLPEKQVSSLAPNFIKIVNLWFQNSNVFKDADRWSKSKAGSISHSKLKGAASPETVHLPKDWCNFSKRWCILLCQFHSASWAWWLVVAKGKSIIMFHRGTKF